MNRQFFLWQFFLFLVSFLMWDFDMKLIVFIEMVTAMKTFLDILLFLCFFWLNLTLAIAQRESPIFCMTTFSSFWCLFWWEILTWIGKHKEAFSTLVESLVQMTCSHFMNFLKIGLLLRKTVESELIYKKFVKSRCRLGYSAEIRVLYCKLGQFQKIREMTAGHLYQGLDLNASLCL